MTILSSTAIASTHEPIELTEHKDQLLFLTAAHWKSGVLEGRDCLILDVPGEQRPPVRRPGEFALWNRGQFMTNYTFSVQAATLEPRSIRNRDICLLFGYQDDTHFYYAHLSSNSDGKFHNIIMRVDGDSRTRINLEPLPEPRLQDGWNTIKVQHLNNGTIKVWAGDMETPLMTAQDKTYPTGGIGFGAFDDRAAFATLHVHP